MIGKLLNYFYLKVYQNGLVLYRQQQEISFREKYSINDSFRFNGENILFQGDGSIICGRNSYIGELSTVLACDGCKVEIGNNCSISHNVRIYTQSKTADQDFSKSSLINKANVIIEDYAWIGANVFINPGVVIGKNSIVGANSVITKNVPMNAIFGGVPAKLIRMKSSNA